MGRQVRDDLSFYQIGAGNTQGASLGQGPSLMVHHHKPGFEVLSRQALKSQQAELPGP
jgi:hypothetical protein